MFTLGFIARGICINTENCEEILGSELRDNVAGLVAEFSAFSSLQQIKLGLQVLFLSFTPLLYCKLGVRSELNLELLL